MPERAKPLPDVVEIDVTAGMPPHTARETSLLTSMTGRDYQALAGEGANDGDRERVIVWFTLRRLGYEPSWEEAGDVLIRYVQPDPTSAASSRRSPDSVATGG